MGGRIGRRRHEVYLWVSSKGAGRLHYQHVSGERAVGFTWKVMFWQLLLGQGPLSAPARTVTHYPGRCETSRGASEAPCPLAVYTVTKSVWREIVGQQNSETATEIRTASSAMELTKLKTFPYCV